MGAQPGGLCRAAPPWRHVGEVWVPCASQGWGWSRLPNTPKPHPRRVRVPQGSPHSSKAGPGCGRGTQECPSPVCAGVWPLGAAPEPGLCHPQLCTGLRKKSPRARSEELWPPLPGGSGGAGLPPPAPAWGGESKIPWALPRLSPPTAPGAPGPSGETPGSRQGSPPAGGRW